MGEFPKAVAIQVQRAAAEAYVAECQRSGLRTPAAVFYAARQFRVSESTIWRWRAAYAAERISRAHHHREEQA